MKAGCTALALLLALHAPADARTRRHLRHHPVAVALQPFHLARAAVRVVAVPVFYRAPRAALVVAAAPIRLAYETARPAAPVYSAPLADEEDSLADEDSAVAEPVDDSEPIEVAYYTARVRRPAPPRRERGEPLDDGDEDDRPRRAQAENDGEISSGARPMVAGNRAVLRGGIAYAPANAPQSVKNAIWATNSLRRKPYIWGGGHGSFIDRGYDCSGTVSFALHHAGALATPIPSSDFLRYGERGRGRWVTIYARPGHTFAIIAGLRLDTTDFNSGGNVGPRWHADGRDTFGYAARHPAGL